MLTLFHAPRSRSSRLVWLLEEIGVDHEIRYCDIVRADGSGARDPANPHPDGKVPALIHDGALITESAAITLYLTDLFPGSGLGPPAGDRDRGEYLTWLAWSTGELEPALGTRALGRPSGDGLDRRYEDAVDRLLDRLWSAPYLMGDRFSAADVLIGSALMWARPLLPESPTLDAYVARLADRPARLRAQARDSRIDEVTEARAA